MIAIVDNFDSFTFNLADYLHCSGEKIEVVPYDDPNLFEVCVKAGSIVFSPGPGKPEDYPLLFDLVKKYAGKKPIFGVCLGMQVICAIHGWKIIKANRPMHGKTSKIVLFESMLWKNIPNQTEVMRYHSLIAKPSENSKLSIIAQTEAGEVMAVENVDSQLVGVQFHPESILTPDGKKMIQNWLKITEKSHFQEKMFVH